MSSFPRALNEADTLTAALAGKNITRIGSHEFRLAALDDGAIPVSPRLVAELRDILWSGHQHALTCIPRFAGPNLERWKTFDRPTVTSLLGGQRFGSSFVFDQGEAPWIDNAAYWARVRSLWLDRHVTVVSTAKPWIADIIAADAASVAWVRPPVDAYECVDEVERQIGEPASVVLLCLGVAGTILSWRFARRRVRAHDLGELRIP